MSHHDLIVLFLQICAMLGVALIFGQGIRRLRFPSVLGELGGGIVLGRPSSVRWHPRLTPGFF